MKKCFFAILAFALLVSMLSISSFAEENSDVIIINERDNTYYNDGKIVFNNYGTVYNNGNCGVVYNNGGIVYNNGGTVYNNCGVVYNNSGTVYNNCGEVAVNGEGGIVVDNTLPPEPEELGPTAGDRYTISLSEDYSKFAYIEGPDKAGLDYYMTDEDRIIITPKPGYSLLNSAASTGTCALQEDGSVVFTGAERDGILNLAFMADAPVITPEFGTYGEAVSVKIIVPSGITVYYTTDGDRTVDETCDVYAGPIDITSSSSFQAMAVSDGAVNSRIISGRYLIPIIKAPVFEPQKKGYDSVEPQAIVVENTGIDRLKIESVTLTGIDAEYFTLSTENRARVDPGQSDKETWKVAPVEGLNTGTYEAAAEFTFEDGHTSMVDISFKVI